MSKKFIILKLRELERDIKLLKNMINEHYGQETKSMNFSENFHNNSSPDIEIYLDLTKNNFKFKK